MTAQVNGYEHLFDSSIKNPKAPNTITIKVPDKVANIFTGEKSQTVLNTVKNDFANTKFETKILNTGESGLKNSALGRSLGGNLLDKEPVRNVFSKAFGTEFTDATAIKISGKDLTAAQQSVLKQSGITVKTEQELLKNGVAEITHGDLKALVNSGKFSDVAKVAKESGTTIEKVVARDVIAHDSAFAAKYASKTMNVVGGASKKILKKELSAEFIEQSGKTAGRLAGKYGAKAAFLAKKTPVIGAFILGALQIPAIYSAFKNEGLGGGLKQVARSGIRVGIGLAVGAVGATIGGAVGLLGGPVGAAIGAVVGEGVGYAVGDWIGEKIGNLLLGKPNTSGVDAKTEAEALDSSATTGVPFDLTNSYITSALPTM